jgi:hypothetical protein
LRNHGAVIHQHESLELGQKGQGFHPVPFELIWQDSFKMDIPIIEV